jgi:hypothetical protein
MQKWIFLIAGLYLIAHGLMSPHLINESEIPATDNERHKAKPDLWKRIIVAGIGVAACAYSALLFFF